MKWLLGIDEDGDLAWFLLEDIEFEMVCEAENFVDYNKNGIFPICACGCGRKIQEGDYTLFTDYGLFLINKDIMS